MGSKSNGAKKMSLEEFLGNDSLGESVWDEEEINLDAINNISNTTNPSFSGRNTIATGFLVGMAVVIVVMAVGLAATSASLAGTGTWIPRMTVVLGSVLLADITNLMAEFSSITIASKNKGWSPADLTTWQAQVHHT